MMLLPVLQTVLARQARMALARLDATDQQAAARCLTLDEQARAERFAQADDRLRFVTGRWLMRSYIGEYLGVPPREVPIAVDAHGKPHVAGAPSFSISHSGGFVLFGMAVSPGCTIGVDVQAHDHTGDLERLERLVYQPQEIAWLGAALDRRHAFYRLWALKEAALKAAGTGLLLDPLTLNICPDALSLQSRHAALAGQWAMQELDAASHASAAVALFVPDAAITPQRDQRLALAPDR